MVRSCCFPGCSNKQKSWSSYNFHRLPKRDDLLQLWLVALAIDIATPRKQLAELRVCSCHFADDDYTIEQWSGPKAKWAKRMLKRTAVPIPQPCLESTAQAMHGEHLTFSEVPQSTSKKPPAVCHQQSASQLKLVLSSPEPTFHREKPSTSGVYLALPAAICESKHFKRKALPVNQLSTAAARCKKARHPPQAVHDRSCGKTRVNIGPAFSRWRELREMEGLKNDAELATLLLDSYESRLPNFTPSKRQKQDCHSMPDPALSSTDSLSPDRLVDFAALTDEDIQSESESESVEDMKIEPLVDSTHYNVVVLGSTFFKNEDIEESIERKNGYEMSRDEELILSNIKEEEEEGGERQSEEVKREDGVKDEVTEAYECKEEKASERNEMGQIDGVLKQDGLPKCMKQEEEGSSSPVTSCLLKQPGAPSPGSPVTSSSKGESEVFACSQCPFIHMEKVKLHQHTEKFHPEEHSRILSSGGNRAENPLPPSSTHQHPTPLKMGLLPNAVPYRHSRGSTPAPTVGRVSDLNPAGLYMNKSILQSVHPTIPSVVRASDINLSEIKRGKRSYHCSQCK